MLTRTIRAILVLSLLVAGGCMSYLTTDRNEVVLPGVDIDQTLEVARMELERQGFGSVLTVWAIRDQYLTPAQAATVSELYRAHVGALQSSFDVWHLTWAIANMYRHGGPRVKQALLAAHEDALVRAAGTHRLAVTHTTGDTLYMGDAHVLGRYYAFGHVVVPGNPEYLQSVAEYRRHRSRDK
jgi:hypothetical protein